jgi:hypothetical protein
MVPAKWKNKPEYESPANDEVFTNAALRIDKPIDWNRDGPYTLHYSPRCGEQGKYIHLTPKFVTDIEFAERFYGPPGEYF